MAALISWLHLTAAAVWVGSQFFIALVAIPALRAAPDPAFRKVVLAGLTRRYGYLGGGSLAVLALTGAYRLHQASPDLLLLSAGGYGSALLTKTALGAVIILLTLVHTLVVGPRLLGAMKADRPARGLARASLALSSVTLVLSLWVLWVVAGLRAG